MTHDHDVIIVGAGFVGLTLAFAYALQGKQVALIEAKTLNEKNKPQIRVRWPCPLNLNKY